MACNGMGYAGGMTVFVVVKGWGSVTGEKVEVTHYRQNQTEEKATEESGSKVIHFGQGRSLLF